MMTNQCSRRRFLQGVGAGLILPAALVRAAGADEFWLDVRKLGAVGDGKAIDSTAVNKAIDEVAARGGGVVHFPPGTYACYTIRLKSNVSLHLETGATILAASGSGYDNAEPQDAAFEAYQDYGHNHWRNSLIWGENVHDIEIFGRGLIWGKGLSRGLGSDKDLPPIKEGQEMRPRW